MKWTGLNELREQFLSFYQSKGHYRMDSASLIPQDDKSLLLINSGMAPLKKYFLGQAKVPGNRATTCQKCIRTPDIERVGKTARHGTYFEMLGNFSFADYFKREATTWAWELITQVWEMPIDRLYVSVYEDDDEAYDIWTKERGVAPDHMVRLGKDDNFWEIGSGPCGPCSEIYFDRGEEYGCGKPTCGVGCDCDRYVEFWNLVFTQFISDGNGHYEKMEHGNIDTGMGLERIACIMQGVDNLFEVDTVQNIMKKIESLTGTTYKKDEKADVSLRVITDHIRSTVFMVGDGVGPSNEGRGYVLRRLLRRAARHGRLLGVTEPFLYNVVDTVIDENKIAYPYLDERRDYIKRVVLAEEERFAKTIAQGLELLEQLIAENEKSGVKTISGEDAFRLYDTFGFPLDLTVDIVSERGFSVDEDAFNEFMNMQKKRARDERKAKDDVSWEADLFKDLGFEPTVFTGYDELETGGKLLAIVVDDNLTDTASEGDDVKLVIDRTSFYAESGGQVGDKGVVESGMASIEITDCHKTNEGYYVLTGTVTGGVIEKGVDVISKVDRENRNSIMRNHTSAHLLQAALRQVLGDHVHQAGSYVDNKRMRFDFSHFEAVKSDELKIIESIVNNKILEAIAVDKKEMPIEEAKKLGAMALFGEKYGDVVRVVTVPGFSVEFCGGTHVDNTASLGLFKILSESSVAAGVRRIEATTGTGVLAYIDELNEIISDTAVTLKSNNVTEIGDRARAAMNTIRENEREIERLNAKLASSSIDSIIAVGKTVGSLNVYAYRVDGLKADALRTLAEQVRDKFDNSVVVLAGVNDSKISIVAACSEKAREAGCKAGDLAKKVAGLCGGSGGGKPDLAMAGGKDISKLDDAVAFATDAVKEIIK